MPNQTGNTKRLAIGLLIGLFTVSGCSSSVVEESLSEQIEEAEIETENTDETGVITGLDESSAETQIQFEVSTAEVQCSGEEVLVTLSGTNLGEGAFSYNSRDYDSDPLPIEAVLKNSDGSGIWDDAWHLSDGEIPPGDNGNILVLFGTLMGFDGTYSLLEVQNGEQTVFDKAVEISGDFCD